MDYASLLYDPIYSVFGVPATLTLEDERTIAVTALDKTNPATIGRRQDRVSFAVEVDTVDPAAMVRVSELGGVRPSELHDAKLAMNGKAWTVRSHLMEPAPTGEAHGEIRLLLMEGDDASA